MRKIKVIHICSSLDGGAGLCARRIMQSTNLLGIDNFALIKDGTKEDRVDVVDKKGAKRGGAYYFQKILHHFHVWPRACRINHKIEKAKINNDIIGVFTSPITEFDISDHQWIADADIIHIHWVGGFMDYESFFKKIKKPIVWTMHDENAGYGGFHYTLWKNMSSPKGLQLENSLANIKKRAYSHIKNMQIVAISSMMKEFINNNNLLKNFPCTLIHNGIDEKLFSLIDRQLARKALGIDSNKTVFIFVAFYIHDDRKGLKVLLKALKSLNIPNTTLICIGQFNYIPEAPCDIRCEGLITNTRLLSLFYSASDYFIMPSYQEAFAQTPLESLACGTPVIAFPCSGIADVICPLNGIICSDFTTESLIDAIKEARKRLYNREEIRKNVVERFSYLTIANQYKILYEQMLANI